MKPYALTISVLVLIGIITFGVYETALLQHPYDWEETEGDHLNYALLLSQGDSPYSNNDAFPMLFMLYPPFFHVLLSGLVKLFGVHVVLGRLISLLAIVAIVWLVYALVKHFTRDKQLALLAAGSVFAAKIFMKALSVGRINALYIALVLAGYYFIVRAEKKQWMLFLATLMFYFSIYTKQLALIPILGAYGYLFLKNRKQALIQGGIFGALSLITLVFLERFSNGWFINNIMSIPGGQANYNIIFVLAMGFYFTLFFAPFIWLCLQKLWQDIKKKSPHILTVYWVSGILIVLIFGWNSGATADYMVPAALGTIMLGSVMYKKQANVVVKTALIACLVIQIFLFSNIGMYHMPAEGDAADAVTALRGVEGQILTERMATISLLAEKEVLIESSVVDLLYDSSVWSPEALEAGIRNQEFGGIFATAEEPFNMPVLNTLINENYELTQEFSLQTRGTVTTRYGLYKPKTS